MDAMTVDKLRMITNSFYLNHFDSFSQTRTEPWDGWYRCIDIVKQRLLGEGSPFHGEPGARETFTVFDLGCGNLRFKTFLESAFPAIDIAYFALDNCEDIVPVHADDSRQLIAVQFQNLDAVKVLASGEDLNDQITAPLCDLTVSFGFMHHVPLESNREKVLASLIDQTRPGGLVIVSFWQFMGDDDMACKAQLAHERAREELDLPDLDENDFILGWKQIDGAYRYCHSFVDDEIEQLLASTAGKATLVERFVSDGRTGDLNTYIVLQVDEPSGGGI